jgi:hypothetical protein
MPRAVTARDVIVILAEHRPVRTDEHRAERLIARLERLPRQLHATAQVAEITVAEHESQVCRIRPTFRRARGSSPSPTSRRRKSRAMTKHFLGAAIAMTALVAATQPAHAGTAVGNPGDPPAMNFLALQEQTQQESRKLRADPDVVLSVTARP